MSNDEKTDPLDDVKKGLGLLFRAAKTAAMKIPTQPLEKVVLDSAREVGRAVENVATSIEKEVFGDRKAKERAPSDASPPPAPSPTTSASAAPTPTPTDAPSTDAKAPDDPPTTGPRVG